MSKNIIAEPVARRQTSGVCAGADLNALVQHNHLALERIERQYPQSPAPAYDEHFAYDRESIIDPLASPAATPRSSCERDDKAFQLEHGDAEAVKHPLHNRSSIPVEPSLAAEKQTTEPFSLGENRFSRVFAHLLDEKKVDLHMSFANVINRDSTGKEASKSTKAGSTARQCNEQSVLSGEATETASSKGSPLPDESSPPCSASDVDAEKIAPEESENEPAYVTGFKLYVLVFALSFAVFIVAMDVNIIATAIPTITKQFESLGDVGWYGSAYLMTTCAFQALFGRLYTFFPPKYMFMVAIGIFELGSLVAGVSPSSRVFIAGRAIQGTGTSGIISGALIIISEVAPLRKRPLITGMIGSMEGIAMISAPLLGGALTDRLSWRWCFYINLPIGAFVLAVVLFYLQAPRMQKNEAGTWSEKIQQLDLVGSALLIPAIVSFLLAFELGGTKYPWNSLGIVMLFLMGFVLLSVFAYFQWRKQDFGTVPPRIMKKRSILAGAFFSLCISSGLVVIAFFLPLWFQAVKGASASNSGVMILPLLLGVIVAVVVSGALVSAIGYYAPFMIAASVFMSLGAGLVSTFKVDTGPAMRITYPILFGAGVGLGFQQPIIAAQAVLNGKDIPIGTSIMVFAQTFGGALMLSIAQTVFSNRLIVEFRARGLLSSKLLSANPTDLKDLAGPELADMVLEGYNNAICKTFYVALTVATSSIVGALAIEWKSVKQQGNEEEE